MCNDVPTIIGAVSRESETYIFTFNEKSPFGNFITSFPTTNKQKDQCTIVIDH